MTPLGLRVWGLAPGDGYDMGVEVGAVAEAAGSGPVHLAGFSAGATVALAAALALGDSVRSLGRSRRFGQRPGRSRPRRSATC